MIHNDLKCITLKFCAPFQTETNEMTVQLIRYLNGLRK